MSDNSISDIIFGGIATILSGTWLYHNKKINDIPEKYLSKSEFQDVRKEIREDVKEIKTSLEQSAKGIHERLDKIFEDIYKPKINP